MQLHIFNASVRLSAKEAENVEKETWKLTLGHDPGVEGPRGSIVLGSVQRDIAWLPCKTAAEAIGRGDQISTLQAQN